MRTGEIWRLGRVLGITCQVLFAYLGTVARRIGDLGEKPIHAKKNKNKKTIGESLNINVRFLLILASLDPQTLKN